METGILGSALVLYGLGKAAHRFTFMGEDIMAGGNVESVSYSTFRERAKTGDLVLTSSTAITSVSRMVTQSIWSHCGVVWQDRDGSLYEWSSHSEGEGVPNTIGRPFGGAQLVPLDYLASDNGTIYWRPIGLNAAQRKCVDKMVDEFKYGVKFSDTPEFLSYFGPIMAKAFNGFGAGMACSHLVATTYIAANAIALDRHITQYTPKTFSDSGDAEWLVEVSERVKMVVGFDTSRLISLAPPRRTFRLKNALDDEEYVPQNTRAERVVDRADYSQEPERLGVGRAPSGAQGVY